MKIELRGRARTEDMRERIQEFFNDMTSCFTPREWFKIKSSGMSQEQLRQFYNHWTLKEGYIKAVGIGLGFELQRAEFALSNADRQATVSIDGRKRDNWFFEIHELPSDHVVSVAYGPPSEADPSCTTINRFAPVDDPSRITRIPFQILSFDELVEGMEPLR
eukprot:TRINITY_DN6546_c0_g2_i3.p1 TRINITY_DN6546_c0_g2~~TRINITY_DN6546_c0_g2_i3.p1  ORF type:complete len:162 (-),score=29.76 TRINITY_DN6546_c0_g2_i3:226-711(-)